MGGLKLYFQVNVEKILSFYAIFHPVFNTYSDLCDYDFFESEEQDHLAHTCIMCPLSLSLHSLLLYH